jgi:predicted P-loop ATPase
MAQKDGCSQSKPRKISHKPYHCPVVTVAWWEKLFCNAGFQLRKNEITGQIENGFKPLTDATAALIRQKMHEMDTGQKPTDLSKIPRVNDAILFVSEANSYHPIKVYLETCHEMYRGIEEEKRTDQLARLLACLGSPDTEILRLWMTKWLVGSCARVMEDFQNYCLIWKGAQGVGKSYFFKWLTSGLHEHLQCDGLHPYFQEGTINPESKDDADKLASKWIWEIGEVGGTMGKRDRNQLKEFLTRSEVSQRASYGRFSETRKRLVNFTASTNDPEFLDDPSGSRRFLICEVSSIDRVYSSDACLDYQHSVEIDLLWGQVMELYVSGQVSPSLTEDEKRIQKNINQQYERLDPFEEWLVFRYTSSEDHFTSTLDILQKANDEKIIGHLDKASTMRLSDAATRLGFERTRGSGGKGSRGYKVKYNPT